MKVILIFMWTVLTTHWLLSSLCPSILDGTKEYLLRKRLWFFKVRVNLASNLFKSWNINRQIYWLFIRQWVHFIMVNVFFTFLIFMQIMLFKCCQIWLILGINGWENGFTFAWKNTRVKLPLIEWISFFFFWLSLHP